MESIAEPVNFTFHILKGAMPSFTHEEANRMCCYEIYNTMCMT